MSPTIIFGKDYTIGVGDKLFWTIGGLEKLKASGAWNGVGETPTVDGFLHGATKGAIGPAASAAQSTAAPRVGTPRPVVAPAPSPTVAAPRTLPVVTRVDPSSAAYQRGREIVLKIKGRGGVERSATARSSGFERALEIARAARARSG